MPFSGRRAKTIESHYTQRHESSYLYVSSKSILWGKIQQPNICCWIRLLISITSASVRKAFVPTAMFFHIKDAQAERYSCEGLSKAHGSSEFLKRTSCAVPSPGMKFGLSAMHFTTLSKSSSAELTCSEYALSSRRILFSYL